MDNLWTDLVVPFFIGFALGIVFCLGLYLMDVGGIRTLALAADVGSNLIIELLRFSVAFGIASVVTCFGLGLVAD